MSIKKKLENYKLKRRAIKHVKKHLGLHKVTVENGIIYCNNCGNLFKQDSASEIKLRRAREKAESKRALAWHKKERARILKRIDDNIKEIKGAKL